MCRLCARFYWRLGYLWLTVGQTSTVARFIYRAICVPHMCWQIVGLQTQRSDAVVHRVTKISVILLIDGQIGLSVYLLSINSQLANNLNKSCAHGEPLQNA